MENKRFRQLLLSRNSLCLLAIVLLTDALMLIIAALDYYPRIVNVDGLYSAEVARNVLSGKGYTTSEMTLYEVNLYFQKGWLQLGPPWSNAGRFPLPVLIRVAAFALVGNNYLAATYLYSMSFQLVSVLTVFCVSLYLFRERLTAFFTSLLFAASPILIFSGINGKETTSDYALFVTFVGLVYWWRKQPQPKLSQALILGLIVGITYLNRFNLGGVMLLCLIPLVVKDALSKRTALSRISKMIVSFIIGFTLIVTPLAIYNTHTFGNPVFSSNSLFQLDQFTRPVKYMNPWWKLSYPFDTADPLSALNMFSGDIISRTISVMTGSLGDFLAMGQTGAGYTWFWWVPIAVSAIAGFWPRLSKGIGFPSTTSEQLRAQGLVWYLLFSNLLLDLPILGLFSAGVEYIWYLYSTLAILAGFGLTRIVRLSEAAAPGILESLNLGGMPKNLARRITNRHIGLAIFAVILAEIILNLGDLPYGPGLNGETVQLAVLLATVPSAAALYKYRRPLLPLVLLFVVLAVPAVRYGIVGSNASPNMIPNWITDENPGMLNYISVITPPNGIVLSAEPWNVVWYADRPSVPFSEFPDEIFLMMTRYHMNIQAVYIADLNSVFYEDIHAPYTYEAYRRIAAYDYTLSGFTQMARGFSDGQPSILLARNDSANPNDLMQTNQINFGRENEASHLVWGWSQTGLNHGVNSTWAQRPGALPFTANPQPETPSCQSGLAGTADAEFTFLSNNTQSRSMLLRVLSPLANQTMMIVLNSNLVYFGQQGTLLANCNCTVRNPDTWVNISVGIPEGIIQNGVNLVSFIFPGPPLANSAQTQRLLLFDTATFF
ncbi:hypothetical protein AUI51_01830 [archaeon 13_1_40CM_2_52_4]|nr:MAG: hypothetical protein AUI51_01830 [archaeon 13_1_40CM_2_52_4]